MERAIKYMAKGLDREGMKKWGLGTEKHREQFNLPNLLSLFFIFSV